MQDHFFYRLHCHDLCDARFNSAILSVESVVTVHQQAGEMKNSVSWKSKTTNVGLWNKLGGWMFGWLLEDVPNMHSSSKANLCSSAIKSHAPFTIPTNHASRRYAQGLESRVDMDATHWPYLNGCSLIERYQASTFGRAEHVRQGENDPKLYMSNTIRSAVAGILRNI